MSKVHWTKPEVAAIAKQLISIGFTANTRGLGPAIAAAQIAILPVNRHRPYGSINSSVTLVQLRDAIAAETMRLQLASLAPRATWKASDIFAQSPESGVPQQPVPQVKRGRGRPRKIVSNTPMVNHLAIQPLEQSSVDKALEDIGTRIGEIFIKALISSADRRIKLTLDEYLRSPSVVLARATQPVKRTPKVHRIGVNRKPAHGNDTGTDKGTK